MKILITLLAVLCTASAIPTPDATRIAPLPPGHEKSGSSWDELWETAQEESTVRLHRAALRLRQLKEISASFDNFENQSIEQKREAIQNYAAVLRQIMQEERDSPSQEYIDPEPDTTYFFDKGSQIDWRSITVPAEGLDTQPLIDAYIGAYSQFGPFYFQCPGYDLWERLDREAHREKFFETFFTPEDTKIAGCVLRNGAFVDIQDYDASQLWDYVGENEDEIDSVRLEFTFVDPGKIYRIVLDTLNNRATVGHLDFTLQSDGWDGVQLTVVKHDREHVMQGIRFIEAVNLLDRDRKDPCPDFEILYPEQKKSLQELDSTIAQLDTCIARAKTLSEEELPQVLERLQSCGSLQRDAEQGFSKQIRVYGQSLGQVEIYYVGASHPRQVIVTKAIDRQE